MSWVGSWFGYNDDDNNRQIPSSSSYVYNQYMSPPPPPQSQTQQQQQQQSSSSSSLGLDKYYSMGGFFGYTRVNSTDNSNSNNNYNYSNKSPHVDLRQHYGDYKTKQLGISQAQISGGVGASINKNPITWAMGTFFICAIVGTSIWATIASVSGDFNDSVFDVSPVHPTVSNDDNSNVVTTTTFGTTKPNIIFVLADDLGWNSMGYEDYDVGFASPTLTAMAQDGIIINSFYGQEVCTPARAALLTGRYPLSVGMQYSMVQTAIPWGLDVRETTIADVLKDDGYSTHIFGKWHLGHYTPRMLPTARGFQTFLGFLNGENYYWSKRNPDHTNFHDIFNSTESCYEPYREDDMHQYSTFFYRDKAIELINYHNFDKSSMFLLMSFQAVHDPWVDINIHESGIPMEYLTDGMYNKIIATVKGRKRRQYAMSLNLMDDAVSQIVSALEEKGQIDNSVIIFASDNGGCYGAGGKNGPLRGTKGSLFEGGTRIDSFFWSPLIPSSAQGTVYKSLFHISDWFPTILSMTGTSYTPEVGYELDSFDHLDAMLYNKTGPRTSMLYNAYHNVDTYQFDMWINGSFAVRNLQYKLMHTYDSSVYGVWYQPEELNYDDDAISTETRCAASSNNDGTFTYWLFDLTTDPYETTNLYDSLEDEHVTAKEELYELYYQYIENAYELTNDFSANRRAFQTWRKHDNYIVPYVNTDDLEMYKGTYPEDCGVYTMYSTDDDENYTPLKPDDDSPHSGPPGNNDDSKPNKPPSSSSSSSSTSTTTSPTPIPSLVSSSSSSTVSPTTAQPTPDDVLETTKPTINHSSESRTTMSPSPKPSIASSSSGSSSSSGGGSSSNRPANPSSAISSSSSSTTKSSGTKTVIGTLPPT